MSEDFERTTDAFGRSIMPKKERPMSDAEIGRDMAKLSLAERLARAVLLFHRVGHWTDHNREVWLALTGKPDTTTRVLCELARELRNHEEAKVRAAGRPPMGPYWHPGDEA
jgi:hypothetical protein